jgi:hypothetical protein
MGAVATAPVNPFVTETTTELLGTIAGVLDVTSVFPRISNIVQQVVPHDAPGLRFRDRTGRAALEARSDRRVAGTRLVHESGGEAVHDCERSPARTIGICRIRTAYQGVGRGAVPGRADRSGGRAATSDAIGILLQTDERIHTKRCTGRAACGGLCGCVGGTRTARGR